MRVLCKNCHKKTDTYGFGSKFKGDAPIHPILSGDLLYKLETLPTTITVKETEIPFFLKYQPFRKTWCAGYKFAEIDLTTKGENIKETIDKLFERLRQATSPNAKLKIEDNFSWNSEVEEIVIKKPKNIILTKDFGDKKKVNWVASRIQKSQCLLCNKDFMEEPTDEKIIKFCKRHNDKINKNIY